ncbi:LppX_LprAFG lipoprotein [Nocardioides acrostichi]|uniref:LppX_LprAFG lipoprotein n=1 Tax=Nocardioides acrostichi TaxID=2784339 RepID=A0A930UY86_9ACTN|nr:LppX_LprAFG lipoprotein [Nocardioides acrostichi]MBF4162311.1 LppX_LprAFG lipoprotein [Nocardioides acrostichi]
MHRLPTRRTSWRIAAWAVATPLVLTGLSACNGDDSNDASATSSSATSAPVTTSASASTSASPSDGASSETDAPSDGSEVSAQEFGDLITAAFAKATTATVTTTVTTTMSGLAGSGGDLTAKGQVDLSQKPFAMAVTMSGPGLGDTGGAGIEMILVDNTIYISAGLPDLTYFKRPLDDPSLPISDLSKQMDPTELVKNVTAGTYEGEETIDGQTTRHYTVTVDNASFAKEFGGLTYLAGARASLPQSVDEEVWFDEEGRIAQLVVDLGKSGTVKTEYTGWGDPVDIKAPPASQVTDMSGMTSP